MNQNLIAKIKDVIKITSLTALTFPIFSCTPYFTINNEVERKEQREYTSPLIPERIIEIDIRFKPSFNYSLQKFKYYDPFFDGDFDKDGVSNIDEIKLGTNPFL